MGHSDLRRCFYLNQSFQSWLYLYSCWKVNLYSSLLQQIFFQNCPTLLYSSTPTSFSVPADERRCYDMMVLHVSNILLLTCSNMMLHVATQYCLPMLWEDSIDWHKIVPCFTCLLCPLDSLCCNFISTMTFFL